MGPYRARTSHRLSRWLWFCNIFQLHASYNCYMDELRKRKRILSAEENRWKRKVPQSVRIRSVTITGRRRSEQKPGAECQRSAPDFCYDSIGVQGAIRSKPCNFSDLLCYPQSAYVQYASIVCLVNHWNSYGWSLRVEKVMISAPFQALDRRVQDVRGVKVTQKGQKSALYRPYCPLVHRCYHFSKKYVIILAQVTSYFNAGKF